MDDETIRSLLDRAGVPWDDVVRDRVKEFAQRPVPEQNVWLYVEMSKMKPSTMGVKMNAVYTTVAAIVLAFFQVNGAPK